MKGYRTIKMFGDLVDGKETIRKIRRKTENMESDGDSEMFTVPEIGIGVPLAT